MRVPLTSYGRGEILSGSLLFLAAMGMSLLLYWPATILLAVLWAAMLAFFRDPERHVESSPDDVLSPADGSIRDVVEVEDLPFLDGPALRIGIFMSVLDVHVNRSPAVAAVRWKSYRPGAFHDARSERCVAENERTLLGLELEDGRRMLLSQIAGVIARRIVCRPSVGDVLQKGQRFGMVKFGSRVELCLPLADQYEVLVRPGDRVRAGKTVVATWSGQRVASTE
ncbi:MAG: phosphatidylserine decarboxylase family protein [Candidatus Brocadiae bacterium]|nr:phosphatidylserine decarboxylase family protein [Candidatus Brocadiia bacterium]